MSELARFNDGDPLDVTKLNSLIDSITELKTTTNNLSSSTLDYVPKVWAGKGEVTLGSTIGSIVPQKINYAGAGFTGTPSITVTPRASHDGLITAYLNTGMTAGEATIKFRAGSDKVLGKKIYFDYIAVHMEANTGTP